MFGDRDRIGAAVVAYRNAGPPRRLDIDAVVAGAQQLHQLQLRRRPVERVVHLHLAEADDVLGIRQRGVEFGAAGPRDDCIETGRRQFARDVHRAQRIVGQQDLRRHRFPSWAVA